MTTPLRRTALLALVGGLVIARLAWDPGMAICGQTTMAGCLRVAVLVVAALGLVTWMARAAWLAVGAAREVAALPRVAPQGELLTAGRRAGVNELVCLDSPAPSAFCSGLLRPRVFVSSGMAASLADDELDAILAHEAEHARRRDPLRRLAGRAAAEVLFWLPLVGWWSRGRLEDAELAADRAAIRRVGRPSLARALRATAIPAGAAAGVGFDGAGPARVTQLLGDQPPAASGDRLRAVGARPDPRRQPGHVRRPRPRQRHRQLNPRCELGVLDLPGQPSGGSGRQVNGPDPMVLVALQAALVAVRTLRW